MNTLPTIIPAKRRVRRKRKQIPSTPPAALNLVAAEYEEGIAVLLTFDRAIDIAALDGAAITVDDGAVIGSLFDATGTATLIGPAIVRLELEDIGPSVAPDVRLSASAGTGIVAVDDGGAWGGVSDVALPFP